MTPLAGFELRVITPFEFKLKVLETFAILHCDEEAVNWNITIEDMMDSIMYYLGKGYIVDFEGVVDNGYGGIVMPSTMYEYVGMHGLLLTDKEIEVVKECVEDWEKYGEKDRVRVNGKSVPVNVYKYKNAIKGNKELKWYVERQIEILKRVSSKNGEQLSKIGYNMEVNCVLRSFGLISDGYREVLEIVKEKE